MSGANGETEFSQADKNVEMWRIKKLIKSLEAARGNGTSMISLIIPPKDQITRIAKLLAEEYGTASNIKSRVNRLSVLSAITSVQQRLKLYNKDDGKEKKVNIDFEPFRPVNTSLYLCDNKFHTEALTALLADDNKFGFIVVDGNGALYGTLSGNTREVLHKFTVELPKKHGRGGQSALRFARLRIEKRHNYVRKVAETATQLFITNDKVNIEGLVLAGIADFKSELSQSDMFDQRLQAKLIKIVDISYGGEHGLNQAIDLSADALSGVKYIQEKKLIQRYFDEISQAKLKILHLRPDQERDRKHFIDSETGAELEIIDTQLLLDWLALNYRSFGTVLEIITDRSQEGAQFVRGFGGIGGILRYQVDFASLTGADLDFNDEFNLDDY
ncbi:Eukaryotic peptide chain release factor subunit [Fasciola hepatica]|uniref:Eukaryotic peptide chain release factor subunit 1 n=1 Tax=Fasciola hepatica TaxID=6192 RepID=A0A4E0R2K2_FASHE|nr:Eukaryotic peptide chain release factor subunit [Fasciola hepatica]